MANVLVGVTGSVAAIKLPLLYRDLKGLGHAVKVVATGAALYFFDPVTLDPADPDSPARNPAVVILDEDEWPGRDAGRLWQRQDEVLHIELRRWADLFVIAPLDANTLAKLASGLCDNCLTCVWRAWDSGRPRILAPAMNTFMWQHPATRRHLRQLALDAGGPTTAPPPDTLDEDGMAGWINAHCSLLRVVGPQVKRLACDDYGVGAMAEPGQIRDAVRDALPPR
jgi:phosphopantothenoylcysteine decarboxylase